MQQIYNRRGYIVFRGHTPEIGKVIDKWTNGYRVYKLPQPFRLMQLTDRADSEVQDTMYTEILGVQPEDVLTGDVYVRGYTD